MLKLKLYFENTYKKAFTWKLIKYLRFLVNLFCEITTQMSGKMFFTSYAFSFCGAKIPTNDDIYTTEIT
jgi:hypothetical protein